MTGPLLPCGPGTHYAELMDHVNYSLDWWAYGGYGEVIRNTGWTLPRTRREVRKAIRANGWNPVGHAGYASLRRQIMHGELLNKELR